MKKLITRFDFLVIVFILLIAAVLFSVKPKRAGSTVIIRVDGKNYKTLDLNNAEKNELTVNGVKIICGEGEAYIESSSCHDKICVKAGHISKKGQSAVCAPNRVSVEITGTDKTRPQAVTG